MRQASETTNSCRPRQLRTHALSERGQEQNRTGKAVGDLIEYRFLIFIYVQIGSANLALQENCIRIALDLDLILSARIKQPRVRVRFNFVQEQFCFDIGVHQLEEFHGVTWISKYYSPNIY